MSQQICGIQGCGGEAVQISNLFLHTLGPDPKTKPDVNEFVECQAWRCTKCGNIQLHGAEATVKVPIRR